MLRHTHGVVCGEEIELPNTIPEDTRYESLDYLLFPRIPFLSQPQSDTTRKTLSAMVHHSDGNRRVDGRKGTIGHARCSNTNVCHAKRRKHFYDKGVRIDFLSSVITDLIRQA